MLGTLSGITGFGNSSDAEPNVLSSQQNVPKSPSIRDWEAPSYPSRMELVNVEGQQLRVTLLGRDHTHIFFLRHDDDKKFRYKIEDLDIQSQEKVKKYPESPMSPRQQENRKLHALHAQSLEEEIDRIDQRLLSIRKEHKKSNSKTQRRTLMREYQELQQERLAFELEVSKYK
ncbi:MAG: hypothetical protein ACON39_05320 [Coraliomargaritaceae bacterium]